MACSAYRKNKASCGSIDAPPSDAMSRCYHLSDGRIGRSESDEDASEFFLGERHGLLLARLSWPASLPMRRLCLPARDVDRKTTQGRLRLLYFSYTPAHSVWALAAWAAFIVFDSRKSMAGGVATRFSIL